MADYGEYVLTEDRSLEDPVKLEMAQDKMRRRYRRFVKKSGVALGEPKFMWHIHTPMIDEHGEYVRDDDGNIVYRDSIAWKATLIEADYHAEIRKQRELEGVLMPSPDADPRQ